LDLSWNHIRQKGAIQVAKGISVNKNAKNKKQNSFNFYFKPIKKGK
jgi:hypothetical protein